ncbi:hypothetical protein GCM10022284_68720 [Streptomyces hundungensis]
MFHYGWETNEDQIRPCVEQCARAAAGDWHYAGARSELVEEAMRRSFLLRGHRWVRRPATKEIAMVTAADPEAELFPASTSTSSSPAR